MTLIDSEKLSKALSRKVEKNEAVIHDIWLDGHWGGTPPEVTAREGENKAYKDVIDILKRSPQYIRPRSLKKGCGKCDAGNS